MGLRSRLLKKLKRTLTSEESAEQPAAPSAPKVFEPPPGTMPPMEDVAAAAPAAEEPATAVETPATAVETPATAVSEQPAAASPPSEPAPEVAVAPIAPPPQPGDLPVRIRNRDDGEESWASDYSTDDAPVRNAHYRPVFESSHRSFRVRVINEDTDLDVILDCEPGEFVLDAADRAGQELPFSCRSGGCLSCSAKVLSGDVEMGEQYVLEDEHVANHFVLLCCSSPLSDIVVRSHQEDNIQ